MNPDVPSYSIQDFVQETAERDHPGDIFELESPKMLEAHVNGAMWSKLGAMIAYRGNLEFKREGMLAGGIGKALMKMVSGEMSPLTEIKGQGKVYLADQGKQISILRLQASDAISVSGKDLLAFESSIQYAITMHRRVAGMLSGGLFSARLTGTGLVAIMSHGRPLTLRVTPNDPVITDPNATVAWSGNLTPELRTDINLKTLIGRGGGETFQMVFRGDGFVVVQPYEESPIVQSTNG
ncbi:MAG: AIM24 family protein [Chthonomonas sp.]|nr:AIM24 family protein [Chthonomonas sp.]